MEDQEDDGDNGTDSPGVSQVELLRATSRLRAVKFANGGARPLPFW